uniref:retention module-containing protein n=1 Tax=uncultured Methylophaga sp. TaxID=285271 RepID=UPI00261EC2ED
MATQIGIVKTLTGEVTATAADGSIRTLQVGDMVYANELISTGQAGAVEIEFADGSIMDLGRSSQAMLDSAVFDPSSAVADASEEDVPDDVAAIQQALLEGEDPTEAGEATAAGAGVEGGNEGHEAVFVDYLNPEVTPDAGFETIGVNSEIDDVEDEQLLDGVPTAGLTVVTLDEDELVEGGSVDLGTAGNEFLNFLNGQGISAFTFDSPNGVGDERPEVGDDPADGYFLSGSLVAAYGLDGPNEDDPISFNAVTGSDVTDSNGNPVTSEGQQVKYWVSADGLTVIGYIAGDSDQSEQPTAQAKSLQSANYDGCEGPGEDYPELAEIIFTAQLTPTEEGGSFLVGIFGQFDHAEPDYANGEFVFEDNLLLNLGFTITDADGDSTTGTLQLDVDDDSPVRAGEGEQLATQTGTVTEDGLSFDDDDLSEGNPNNAVAMTVTSGGSDADQSDIESFLGLSAGALEPAVDSNGGSGNATNGSASKSTLNAEAGDIISFNWSFDNNDGGSFNDFAFVVINGEVFELADSNGGDLASNPFTYEVTADGVISIGFGQMNVGDQIVDSSLTVSDLTLNGSPVNGGFDGSLTGWDTLGNVSDNDSLVNSDVTSGNLNTVVNMGADGPGSFGLLQASENEAEQALFQAGMDSLPTLSSKGEAVSYSVMMDGSDSVLVATAGEGDDAREVFTLTIDSDGQWTFDLNDQLDHVAGETAEENFSLITLDENGEPNGSVDSIDFTQLLQIRDFDGDQLIITEDDAGMLSISIQDDIPVATGETVNVSVDEDDIVTDNSTGNDPFDNADDGSYTGEPVTIFGYTTDFFNIFNGGGPATTTGSVSSLVSFGADETGTFSLGDNFAALEGQGLTSKGDELSFEVNGDTLIASADGRAVFTLELADNGDFTFSLYDQIDHAAGNGENNLPLDLSSVIQATDSDNDTITLENGFVIDVTDDIPEQAGVLPDIGIVEEEALPAGNQEENDGSIFGYPVDGWPDTAVATGSLQDQVSVGADENVTFAFAADLSGLPELTSNGLPVSYEVNGDTLTASTEAGEVFTLTLNSEGDYVFTLTGALDHDAGQGENLEVINFSSIIEATDFDGDTITLDNDFYIKIVDDMPVATGESVSVTVDEDDIQTDNSSGNDSFDNDSDGSYTGEPVTVFGYTTDFFNIFNGGGPATTSGSVATLVSFGADENGTFSLGNDFAALEGQNLTSKGDELSFEVNGDTLVASADGRAVFTLELDDNGDFTFSLYDQLDHATGDGENNLPLDLSSVIQATDSDLDTITLDSGFTIDVTDDVPEYAGGPDLGIVEEEALPAGNQEENDGSFFGIPLDGWPDTAVATGSLQDQVSVGADDDATFSLSGDYTSLIAQNLTSNDVPVTYQLDGDTLTASAGQTPVFTLTLSSNGDYIFTLMGPLDHPESYVEENPLVIDLSGVVIAEDFDGDAITLNNDLFIKIIDDSPEVAENAVVGLDDDALAGGNPGGTGDDANAVNVTGTLSHSFGADGGSISWQTSGAPSGFTYEASGDDLLIKQGSETVLTLSLNPETGEYSVTQNAPIKHQDDGNNDENNQLFNVGYLVTDNDDDTATGSLQINVDDDTPTVEPYEVNTMRIISDDDTVDGLNGNPGEGSNTNDGAGTDSKEYNQSKTLQFSAGADGGTVAWNVDNSSVDDATAGISFSVNGDGSLIITQMQNGVPVEVAEITLDANTGDYNYTQTSNVLHTPGDNENEAAFTLGFTVTDGDGDTADGYLTLLIDDDTPVVTSQQLNLLTESFEDFAPDLSGNNWTVVGEGGGTIIGNNGIEWTVNGAGIEIQSGNVGGASASDGDVHAELDAHDSNGDGGSTLTKLSTEVDLPTADATLSFDFQPRPSDVDGSDMTVSLGGQEVTINVDGSGVIDFGTLPSGVSASQSSSAGGWTTITLSFTGLDTNSAQTLSFEGVGSENTLGAFIDNISLNAVANLTVDESALADGSGEAGASTTASYDFSGFFTGGFGADGPAGTDSESYALNLNGVDVGSGLFVVDNADTSSTDGDGFGQGEEILLNQDGNQIVGSAGGVDYFTISVNDDGEVTLTQLENIWHADTTNPDDSQSMVLDAELLTLVKTITDADQDSAEATLDLGGVNFNFEDDAPAIEAQQPAQPYLLTIANEGGDAGYNNTYGYFIKGENGEPVSGEIIWANVKDNESGEVTVEVTDPSDIGFFIIPDGDDLNDLNNGDAVTFEQDGDGNWQVVLDGEPLTGQGTNVLFNDAALNQDGAQAVEDNAAAGNQNWEDIIGGDNDFNDVNINVSISQLGAITVDETDIGNGDPSNATATLNLSGSFTADFGADGEGDVDYGLSVDTDVNTGLIDTQSGEEVLLRVVDGEVEGYINDGSDQVVFTVTVDSDGEVTLTQLRAVEHDDATDPDEANSPATINAGAISLGATVTDADGDSADASLDLGVLFAFEDDGPVAVDDADSVVDGLAEGNVLTAASTDGESGADSFGADGPGSVTSVTFGNTTYDVPSEGSVDIDGDFGTLTLHADGSYEYNVNSENVPQNTETVEGWVATDSNMTAFNLGESFLDADGKFSDSGNGTVTSGGNTQGFGVAGTSGANTSVPEQVNQSGSQSEALAFKFTGDVTSATVQFSNLFNNENGGEAMRWHAFDADGNRIDSGIVSDNDASDPYAGDTTVNYSSDNEGSFTISDIGAFSTLVFEGVPYSNDGSDGADDSDFFVNITSYDVFGTESNQYQDQFTYEITDADGDSDSATLTVNGQSEPEQGELDAIAPVAADNTYQVDGETSGNIITDDDDNGGAETGRDYDNDTPVINLSINSVIVNGVETEVTADNTVIGLENGTLVINLDGSYTYTPAQDADGGDEFEYTLVDPDGEVSEPATVTLLEPLVSDVVTLGDVTVNEGDGTATITGSVENAVTGSPLVITLNNGATITIDVGETSGASTPFPVQGDDPYIDGETITLSVTGTDGGNYSSLDTLDTSTVTVNDTIDDVTVVLSATSSTSEDGGSITYTASLVDGDNNPVTTNNAITVTLANGESITIDAGDSSGDSAPVAVNQDDLVLETDSIDNNITG